jgi:hypothetical protein
MKLIFAGIFFVFMIILLINRQFWQSKKTYSIETTDITHFWQAFDSLKHAHNYRDSLEIIRQNYLDRMTFYGEKFITARSYTDTEFIRVIRKYPIYFQELRRKTDHLIAHYTEIDSVFGKLNIAIPDYRIPDICFAIGCFRGGGTITKNKDAVLIGCEIAFADSIMNITEFTGTLQRMFSHADGSIGFLIAHESIHCQQWNGQNNTLLSLALSEGTADFLAGKLLHRPVKNPYGFKHECELWQEFKSGMNSIDISKWMYNTSPNEIRPADLGYFMDTRICEAYYDKRVDKAKAITFMLNRANYLGVLSQSGYNGNCRN